MTNLIYSATPIPDNCIVDYEELNSIKEKALLRAVRTNKPQLVVWIPTDSIHKVNKTNSIWLKDNRVICPPHSYIKFDYIEYLPQFQSYKQNWYSVILYCKESIPTPILWEDNIEINKEIAKYYTPYQAECYLNNKWYYPGMDPYYTKKEPQYMRASFYINH